jgi:predicted RNase H-like HicB family nuclease
MFTDYVQHVMRTLAQYDILDDNPPYYGSIKGFKGVWAQGKTLQECEENLREVLEEWLLIKIRKKKLVPSTRKFNINALLN